MPRDLFGHVTRPSISIGNRKWYTVPVSLMSHAVMLAMIVIVPIIAAPMMPGVVDGTSLTRFIDIVPPTPPPVPPPEKIEINDPPARSNDDAAPTIAPDRIGEERPAIETHDEDLPGIITGDVTDPGAIGPPPELEIKNPPAPVRVGGAVRNPVKTHSVDPIYPPIAQAARVQGIVIIEATIAEDGRVVNARILRSIPLLDVAALDAVRQWQFTPSVLNGVPVPVIMTVTVNFTLSK